MSAQQTSYIDRILDTSQQEAPTTTEAEVEPAIEEIYQLLLQRRSDNLAFNVLWNLDDPIAAPFVHDPETEDPTDRYNAVLEHSRKLVEPEILQFVLQQQIDTPRKRFVASELLTESIRSHVQPKYQEISNSRNTDDFWQNNLQQELATTESDLSVAQITQFIDSGYHGTTRWDRYREFRTQYLRGGIVPEPAAHEIFDIVERALSRQDLEILMMTVEHLHAVGLDIEEFVRIKTGVGLEQIEQDMAQIGEQFRIPAQAGKQPVPYVQRLDQYSATPEISEKVRDELSVAKFRQLCPGSIIRQHPNKALFIFIPKQANIDQIILEASAQPDETAKLFEQSQIWQLLQSRSPNIILLVREIEEGDADNLRLQVHESTHALAYHIATDRLRIDPMPASTGLLAEIPSTVGELSLPQQLQEFIKRKQYFLTTKYAALAQHEVDMWLAAQQLYDGELDSEEFLTQMEKSYQTKFQAALDVQMPTGACLRDGLIESATYLDPFLSTAVYAYAGVAAAAMRTQFPRGETATMKYLERMTQESTRLITQAETPNDCTMLGEQLEYTIQQALDWYRR